MKQYMEYVYQATGASSWMRAVFWLYVRHILTTYLYLHVKDLFSGPLLWHWLSILWLPDINFPPSMGINTIFHCLPLYHSKEKLFNPFSIVNWDIRGQKKRLYVKEGDKGCPGGATTFPLSRWRCELEYNCKKHMSHQKYPRAPRHI